MSPGGDASNDGRGGDGGLLLTRPADARTTVMEEFVCPVGGERFSALVDASGTMFCQRLDFKRIGMIGEPPLAPECPSNGFVIFSKELPADEIERLEPWVASAEYQDQIRPAPTYYLIARTREFLGHPPEAVAWHYLQASWQVERTDPDASTSYLRAAVARLDEFIAAGAASGEPRAQGLPLPRARFLALELLRRAGDFEALPGRAEALRSTRLVGEEHLAAAVEEVLRLAAAGDASPHAATWVGDRERCEGMVRAGW